MPGKTAFVIRRHGLTLDATVARTRAAGSDWIWWWNSEGDCPLKYATRELAESDIRRMPEWLRAGCEVVEVTR